uniref:Uncharacterized protein n=1 Tax=Arundo donax TaxID=35708 RepID=A0A0A8ZT12_ARUDO
MFIKRLNNFTQNQIYLQARYIYA